MIGFLVKSFEIVLYRPIFNFLVLIYNYFPGHDFGISIIIVTLVIRFLLYPSTIKAIKIQKALGEIQPKLQEIQKKYKDDKEKQVKETLALYKQAKVNPLGSLLPTLMQLPLLIALYQVFWNGFKPEALGKLYGFVFNPGYINPSFLGLVDLSKSNLILAVIAGIFQFIQSKTAMPNIKKAGASGPDFANMMQKQMIYFFPFLTIIILMRLPSALGLYWAVGSIFMIVQQYIIFKKPTLRQTQGSVERTK